MNRTSAKTLSVPCRIAVERSHDSLHAHVLLGGGIEINPGDVVQVQGDPIEADHDSRFLLRREAHVQRAGWLARQWACFIAIFEITGLYEVSFSPRRKP